MTRSRSFLVSFSLGCLLAVAGESRAQVLPLGGEFRANSYTPNSQLNPVAAIDAAGGFVVVWDSDGQDGEMKGVFGRRFSSTGAGLASEFRVNNVTVKDQSDTTVGMSPNGSFVVAWRSRDQDGSLYGLFARRFSSSGVALGSEFLVNSHTSDSQLQPVVAVDAEGDFVVAWQGYVIGASNYDVFARRFSSAGNALGVEFQANVYTPNLQLDPAVASEADGDFVITWSSNGQDGPASGVFARRFASNGSPLATEFQVNLYTADNQSDSTVATVPTGGFVVAWTSNYQDGSNGGVFSRRFESNGAPLGGELQVNLVTDNYQSQAQIGGTSSGGFVVVWKSVDQDGSGGGVFGRLFSSSGTASGGEFLVNSFTSGEESVPALASAGSRFVVAWQGNNQDGGNYGVFAQRYASSLPTMDVDGNGVADALTDGLLMLRYLFGFRGATLVTGVVDLAGCTRCTAGPIETYLAGLAI